jgi:hypothetical protein
MTSKDVDELLSLVEEHHKTMTPSHVATALHRIAKHGRDPALKGTAEIRQDRRLDIFEGPIDSHLPEFNARDLSNILWGYVTPNKK